MAAEEILRFALFKEVLKPARKKKRKLNDGVPAASDSDSDDDDDEGGAGARGDEDEVAEAEKRMEMPAGSSPRKAAAKGKGRKPPTARRSASKEVEAGGEEEDAVGEKEDVSMKVVEDEDEEIAEPPTQGSQGPVAPERFVSMFFLDSSRALSTVADSFFLLSS